MPSYTTNLGITKLETSQSGKEVTINEALDTIDAAIGGGTATDYKSSVRAATTANITLSGAQTIDGVSVIAGDRVLVKNQSTGSQNGIYVCAAGAWARASDADSSAEVTAGMVVPVAEGSTNADTAWLLTTNDPITLGSTALVFSQFGSSTPTGSAGGVLDGSYPNPGLAASVAGAGLTESSDVLSVNVDGSTLEIDSDTLRQKDAGTTNAKLADMAAGTIKLRAAGAGAGVPIDGTAAQAATILKPELTVAMLVSVSDETTTITAGTAKITFRMPLAFTLTSVKASLTTASSSGAVTVDINEEGTTILSTKLTIDQGEETSTTAATPAVISDAALADDAEMTIDIDGAGTGAAGLKVTLIGYRT